MFSCKFCEISKNICFTEHLLTTASDSYREVFSLRDYPFSTDTKFHAKLTENLVCVLGKIFRHYSRAIWTPFY